MHVPIGVLPAQLDQHLVEHQRLLALGDEKDVHKEKLAAQQGRLAAGNVAVLVAAVAAGGEDALQAAGRQLKAW
jgi:hypothetical protein